MSWARRQAAAGPAARQPRRAACLSMRAAAAARAATSPALVGLAAAARPPCRAPTTCRRRLTEARCATAATTCATRCVGLPAVQERRVGFGVRGEMGGKQVLSPSPLPLPPLLSAVQPAGALVSDCDALPRSVLHLNLDACFLWGVEAQQVAGLTMRFDPPLLQGIPVHCCRRCGRWGRCRRRRSHGYLLQVSCGSWQIVAAGRLLHSMLCFRCAHVFGALLSGLPTTVAPSSQVLDPCFPIPLQVQSARPLVGFGPGWVWLGLGGQLLGCHLCCTAPSVRSVSLCCVR